MAEKGMPCTKCGLAEPDVEFYDYTSSGGSRLPECKKCRIARSMALLAVERSRKADDVMHYLRRCTRRTRHARVFSMIKNGQMSVVQFRVVLESGVLPVMEGG